MPLPGVENECKNGALRLSKSENKWGGGVEIIMISFMNGPMHKIQRKLTKKFLNFLCQPSLELTSTKRLLLLLLRLVKLTHSLLIFVNVFTTTLHYVH